MAIALIDSGPRRRSGLWLFEWAMLVYALLTLVAVALLWGRLVTPLPMLGGRVAAIVGTLLLWRLYRRWPCRLMALMRVTLQVALLGWWYPDTYEFNRLLPSLDHLFADADQWLFSCQPALLFSRLWPQQWVSEPLCLGYVSYYPMIVAVLIFYFQHRREHFAYSAFVILASFFLFYAVFDLLPVAGPQFYYAAVGTDNVASGVLPSVGNYFFDHQAALPTPGHEGFFHTLVRMAHDAGERPTAAFPSSHIGISVVLLWLTAEARAPRLFAVLAVLTLLMFFATVYIQAHYAVDAIAGLFAGTAMFFLFRTVYHKTNIR